jgi:hypothetical protein
MPFYRYKYDVVNPTRVGVSRENHRQAWRQLMEKMKFHNVSIHIKVGAIPR